MSTVTAPKALVSMFARFVQGDIKGGAHAHAFRVETIRNAIEQMFKGNYSPINEASALTEGKAKKSRAYHAGFATFGVIGTDTVKVSYIGALNSAANVEKREEIATKTEQATNKFFAAFDAVMAEKAEPKAKSDKKADAPATEGDTAPVATTETHDKAVSLDNAVTAMIAALNTGALTGAQLEELADAVRACEVRNELAAIAAKKEANIDALIAESNAEDAAAIAAAELATA